MLTLTRDYATQARTTSGINILLGIWVLVSAWMLHYDNMGLAATLNSVIVGAVIAVLAAVRLNSWRDHALFSWVNVVLGLWTIASPWVYGYAANVSGGITVIAGVLVVVFGILSGGATIAEKKHPPGVPAH